jgi:transcription elongation GreA/GreB family factor
MQHRRIRQQASASGDVKLPTSTSETVSPIEEEESVQVGDRVLLAFNDEPGRQHTIAVTADRTDEAMGVFSTDNRAGKALLGAMIEDEILIPWGEKSRSATILRIARPS